MVEHRSQNIYAHAKIVCLDSRKSSLFGSAPSAVEENESRFSVYMVFVRDRHTVARRVCHVRRGHVTSMSCDQILVIAGALRSVAWCVERRGRFAASGSRRNDQRELDASGRERNAVKIEFRTVEWLRLCLSCSLVPRRRAPPAPRRPRRPNTMRWMGTSVTKDVHNPKTHT